MAPLPAKPSAVATTLPATARPRVGGDRCPGALRLHAADDGALARVRIPGGLLDVPQAEAIAAASRQLGDGAIYLTSRGNVQLRGLPLDAGSDLADRLYAVGLLPSFAHERARNVVASPLSGLDGAGHWPGHGAGHGAGHGSGHGSGDGDAQHWVRQFDELLCADPRLAQLSGRFLFGFDDGRGDILSLSPDVTLVAASPEVAVSPEVAEVFLDGSPIGVRVPAAQAAPAAIVVAHAFLDQRAASSPDAWRIADLSVEDAMALVADVRERLLTCAAGTPVVNTVRNPVNRPVRSDAPPRPPLGLLIGRDGSTALSVGVPLGRMTLEAWNALVRTAIRGGRTLRLTPWRGVVLPGFAAQNAAAALAGLSDLGLLTEADSPWFGATACAGRPGCAKALADVHDDAHRALVSTALVTGAAAIRLLPVHWSGCERRCGHPIGPHIDVVATGSGYQIGTSGEEPTDVTNDEMAQAVSVARRTM